MAEAKEAEKPKPRVLVCDKLGPAIVDELKSKYETVVNRELNGDPMKEEIAKFKPHVIIVRSTKVTPDHLNASTTLSLVIRAGSGYNTIDCAEASAKGIYVANCPGKNGIAVAELTMAHLCNMDRRVADNVALLRQGGWNKKEFGKARGLYGRTLALLGTGVIGKEVAIRAQAFGMKCQGFDPFLSDEDFKAMGVKRCYSMAEACKDADAATVHIPLNAHTKHIVNKEAFAALKDGAYFIHTARGGVVNEEDMLAAVKEKNIRCGLDVYENEPKATDKEFKDENIFKNPNIYGTHHIGASTAQAEDAVGEEVLRILSEFFKTGNVPNCVNLARKSPAKFSMTVRYEDTVGVLASILNVLANEKVNVQELNNIVFQGAKCCAVTMQTDTKASDAAIAELNKNEKVYAVEVSAL